MRTTRWPPTRSGSATTTGWPRWWPRLSTLTCWCCSPTWTRSTPATRQDRGLSASMKFTRRRTCPGSAWAGPGTGGMVTKVEAVRIATGAGIPVVLTAASLAAEALSGKPVGTFFHRVRERPAARLFWLAHATAPRGRLHLDAGAVRAVVGRRASLLPAGITAVDGQFSAGDPVDLVDTEGRPVARGLVNYDAVELPGLLGRSTVDLGPGYGKEVVHRDDLVLL